jgi:hypothetical protein
MLLLTAFDIDRQFADKIGVDDSAIFTIEYSYCHRLTIEI